MPALQNTLYVYWTCTAGGGRQCVRSTQTCEGTWQQGSQPRGLKRSEDERHFGLPLVQYDNDELSAGGWTDGRPRRLSVSLCSACLVLLAAASSLAHWPMT